MFELFILCSGCGLVSIWLVCLLAVGDFVSTDALFLCL